MSYKLVILTPSKQRSQRTELSFGAEESHANPIMMLKLLQVASPKEPKSERNATLRVVRGSDRPRPGDATQRNKASDNNNCREKGRYDDNNNNDDPTDDNNDRNLRGTDLTCMTSVASLVTHYYDEVC